VEGATGNIHTNYQGKVDAAIQAFESGYDIVYLHVEAPDECGHRGELDNKVKAIELIDEKVVAPIYTYFSQQKEDFKIGILPDHPTPLRIRTHTNEPVPYLIYDSRKKAMNPFVYSEQGAKASGKMINKGYQFMPYFLGEKL
jgi:2,3-bisphosphoglycerate-independent phosphoglycerate mutase